MLYFVTCDMALNCLPWIEKTTTSYYCQIWFIERTTHTTTLWLFNIKANPANPNIRFIYTIHTALLWFRNDLGGGGSGSSTGSNPPLRIHLKMWTRSSGWCWCFLVGRQINVYIRTNARNISTSTNMKSHKSFMASFSTIFVLDGRHTTLRRLSCVRTIDASLNSIKNRHLAALCKRFGQRNKNIELNKFKITPKSMTIQRIVVHFSSIRIAWIVYGRGDTFNVQEKCWRRS